MRDGALERLGETRKKTEEEEEGEANNNYNNILFPFPITNGIAHRKEKKDRERKKLQK